MPLQASHDSENPQKTAFFCERNARGHSLNYHLETIMSKVTLSIQYAGLQLPIAKNENCQDVTPLKPISDLFGLRWEQQREKVNGAFYREYLGTCTLLIGGADGQKREQTCILVSRVAAYLMTINPERVKSHGNESGAEYLKEKLNEWADALHDYEELGIAVNLNHIKAQELLRKQRMAFASMIGIKNKTQEQADRKALSHILKNMAGEIGVPYQLDLMEGKGG
jgi:hypothetical protein